ncbi:MAG: flippase-like domain-containing protein [Bacteroidales bacterium]|nr:flippase-like domain-containing protein [Bacteroidales bacterium]
MKRGLKNSIRVILFLFLGVVLLWISFKGIDLKKLGETLSKAEYGWLLLSSAVSIIALFIRARRWTLLIEPLGYKPSLLNTYHSLVTGYFANLVFPRLGEITRCAALGKKEKLPFDKLVGTVLVERTIDVLTVLVLLGLTIIAGSKTTGRFLSENVIDPANERLTLLIGSSTILYVAIIAMGALGIFLYFFLRDRLSGKPFFRKLYSFFDGIIEGLKSIASLRRKWEFIILTIFLWITYLFMAYLPLLCLESTSGLGLSGAMFILVVGSFGMAVPVQSGMGAFHWIVSRGLLMVYGIPLEEGLAYATISHESQLLLIAVLGATSLFILFGKQSGRILSPPSPEKVI